MKEYKRIEYHSKLDSKGRCSFTIYMSNGGYSPGHPDGEYVERECGQCFYADPTTYGFPYPNEK